MVYFLSIPNKGKLAVTRYGTGPEVILILPGYNEPAVSFSALGKGIGAHFTIYVIDLPFQGATDWQTDQFTPADIHRLLHSVKVEFGIKNYHLLGHSLGGRLLLKILSQPDWQNSNCGADLNHLCLIAPDGISGNYTQAIDRIPGFLVKPLAAYLKEPRGLLPLAELLRRLGLIGRFSHRYLRKHLNDPEARLRMSKTLRSLPKFRLEKKMPGVLSTIPSIHLLLGARDYLINHRAIREWSKGHSNVELIEYNGGHGIPTQQLVSIYTN